MSLNSLPANKKIIWLAISGIVLLFAIVIALIIMGVNLIISSAEQLNSPKPAPPIVEEPKPLPPKKDSFYASDSGLLKIRTDLLTLRKDIDTVDLFEIQLAAPNLDLNISIPVAD